MGLGIPDSQLHPISKYIMITNYPFTDLYICWLRYIYNASSVLEESKVLISVLVSHSSDKPTDGPQCECQMPTQEMSETKGSSGEMWEVLQAFWPQNMTNKSQITTINFHYASKWVGKKNINHNVIGISTSGPIYLSEVLKR